MNRKYVPATICILIAIMIVAGCGPPASTIETPDADSPTIASTATAAIPTNTSSPTSLPDTTTPIPITATPVPTTTPIPSATPVPTPTEPAIETYIAHLQGEKLLVVTHVVGGRILDTQHYMELPFRQGIYKMGWSPSGRYLAFSMVAEDLFSHVFIVDVGEEGMPIDLGIANDWAWSPDSSLLAFTHEYDLWLYSPADGQSRRLTSHLGGDWLWGSPVFAPDGNALIAPGTLSDDMDRRGNTLYKLYRVPLDGSAAGSYPPAGSAAGSV